MCLLHAAGWLQKRILLFKRKTVKAAKVPQMPIVPYLATVYCTEQKRQLASAMLLVCTSTLLMSATCAQWLVTACFLYRYSLWHLFFRFVVRLQQLRSLFSIGAIKLPQYPFGSLELQFQHRYVLGCRWAVQPCCFRLVGGW